MTAAKDEGQPNEDVARFAARLRELRAASGLTQDELAARAGLTAQAITRWERGVREPSWSNLLAVCRALGVSCEAFTSPPAAPSEPPRRGRPRKTAQPTQDASASGEAADTSTTAKKTPAKGRKRKM